MILLVEDDVIIRYDLASVLRNAGYEVMEASDGNGALALIEKSPPDLVITDVRMPAESGPAPLPFPFQFDTGRCCWITSYPNRT